MAVKDKIIKKKHWTQEEFDALMAGVPISDDKSPETLAKIEKALKQIEEGKVTRVKHSELDKFLDSL
jgi:hypothetical protein